MLYALLQKCGVIEKGEEKGPAKVVATMEKLERSSRKVWDEGINDFLDNFKLVFDINVILCSTGCTAPPA